MWKKVFALVGLFVGIILLLRTAAFLLFAVLVLYSLGAALGLFNPFLFTLLIQNIGVVVFLAVAVWILSEVARSALFLK